MADLLFGGIADGEEGGSTCWWWMTTWMGGGFLDAGRLFVAGRRGGLSG